MLDLKLDVHGNAILSDALTKDIIITNIVSLEGGYVNNPLDIGGETNLGITSKVAKVYKNDLKSKFGWDGSMRNLTLPMATYIYDKEYWTRNKLDLIFEQSPCLADKLFDLAVNMGASRGIKILQLGLNVLNRDEKDYKDISVDGDMGSGTRNALASLLKKRGTKEGSWTLIRILTAKQISHYIDLAVVPGQETFMFGWMNRAEYNQTLYRRLLTGQK